MLSIKVYLNFQLQQSKSYLQIWHYFKPSLDLILDQNFSEFHFPFSCKKTILPKKILLILLSDVLHNQQQQIHLLFSLSHDVYPESERKNHLNFGHMTYQIPVCSFSKKENIYIYVYVYKKIHFLLGLNYFQCEMFKCQKNF